MQVFDNVVPRIRQYVCRRPLLFAALGVLSFVMVSALAVYKVVGVMTAFTDKYYPPYIEKIVVTEASPKVVSGDVAVFCARALPDSKANFVVMDQDEDSRLRSHKRPFFIRVSDGNQFTKWGGDYGEIYRTVKSGESCYFYQAPATHKAFRETMVIEANGRNAIKTDVQFIVVPKSRRMP